MEVTLQISDAIYEKARVKAEKEGKTLSKLVEERLESELSQRGPEWKLYTFDSGKPFVMSPEEIRQTMIDTDYQFP